MEEEFLAKNNACGQTLLHLVSRGNAIIAELLRLKDYIPSFFRLENKQDLQKYGDLLLDFSYFSDSESFDKKIEKNERLSKLDEEIRETYGELLERFYLAYESIYKYVTDLNDFIENLEEGTYIQQNLDTVFLSPDGMQLMCESVYIYGVMLLVLDVYHCGPIRERVAVAHSRYGVTLGRHSHHVCHLITTTGYTPQKRPLNYPVDYFKRVVIKKKVIDMVMGKLRTEDIYHGQKSLPLAQHSTTALASQASLLFVVLFFAPDILNNQASRMREIVDKFFPDNWIINIYMGITANVIEMWEPFKAARTAIGNILDPLNIKEYASLHSSNLQELVKKTDELLKEGGLSKRNVLEESNKVLSCARECNVTLRWLLLHTSKQITIPEILKKSKTARDQVFLDTKFNPEDILKLLLNTSLYENIVIDLFKTILAERDVKWSEAQAEAKQRVEELAEVFAGTKPLMRVSKSESLRSWFTEVKSEVEVLSLDGGTTSARKIVQLIQALQEVQGYPQVTSNMQVSQLVEESCEALKALLAAVTVRDSALVQLQLVGDFGYGWLLVDEFTPLLQEWIRRNPAIVNRIRALLHKLSAAMETCLLRMNEAGLDGDVSSVSLHYSGRLVGYARSLLSVVPATVFRLMATAASLHASSLPDLPLRLDKDKLRHYACMDARFQVAKLVHEISVFSSELSNMESTLVGVVRIEPRHLLEDGIRKELASHIHRALSEGLTFSTKSKGSELVNRLTQLGDIIDGHQRSFEYMQDYLNISGTKMWQDELRSVIEKSVEEECERVRKFPSHHKVMEDSAQISFMGQLTRQLILITDPKLSFYLETESSWYDCKTKQKVIDFKFFSSVIRAIGVAGLVGIDRIIAFMIVKLLQNLIDFLNKDLESNKSFSEGLLALSQLLQPYHQTIDMKVYGAGVTRMRAVSVIAEGVSSVGHLQLLRRQISLSLCSAAHAAAPLYTAALKTLNQGLVREAVRGGHLPGTALAELAVLLDRSGLGDPRAKLYIATPPPPHLALLLFLYTITHVTRFSYDSSLDCLVCKKTNETVFPSAVGLCTILRQFHPKLTDIYLNCCCQYIKSYIISSLQSGKVKDESAGEWRSMLLLLEELVEGGGLTRTALTALLPRPLSRLFSQAFLAQ